MPERNKRVEGNAAGKYYVDSSCIACETCVAVAPGSFRMKDDGSLSMVYRQPETESELQNCEDARNSCPAEAIGNDG